LSLSELKKKILRLLREDEEFRFAVAGLLGLDAILNELKKLREDFNRFIELEEKRWEENSRRWEENNKRWEENWRRWEENVKWWEKNWKLWEENSKRWEENWRRWEENTRLWEEAFKRFEAIERKLLEHDKRFEIIERKLLEHDMRFNRLERKLTAIGARWGVESEEAFREAMSSVLREVLGVVSVEKWRYYDEEGYVLGYPAWVEVDLVIRDNVHILVEVKASANELDVAKLWKIGQLYVKITGVKPKLILVTPFIDEKGVEVANKLGVEIYTSV